MTDDRDTTPRKVIVCGGRAYLAARVVRQVLDGLHASQPIAAVVQGGADGADRLAVEWAWDRGIPVATYSADWRKHGRRAGPIRNREMIREAGASLVVAFPGGAGTADCVRQARAAGLPVVEVA